MEGITLGAILTMGGGMVVNIILVAYFLGRLTERVSGNEQRIGRLERIANGFKNLCK